MGSSTRFTVISVVIAVLIGVVAYKVEPYFTKKRDTMSNVIIYSTATCPYCIRAKQLLMSKNVQFIEYFVDKDSEKREEMLRLSGGRWTVPQIFINDKHIGGCDDLYQLESDKKLDDLLKK